MLEWKFEQALGKNRIVKIGKFDHNKILVSDCTIAHEHRANVPISTRSPCVCISSISKKRILNWLRIATCRVN